MSYDWKIKCFAGLVQKLGSNQLSLSLPQMRYSAQELKEQLCQLYPEHSLALTHCYLAANMQYCHNEQIVSFDQELAILPPVSGGQANQKVSNAIAEKYVITTRTISTEEVMQKVITPDCGATLLFVGTTREFTNGQRTVSLDYECYEPMAVAMMKQIGEEIAERWEGADCAMTHRIGSVGLAEISVVIAVATAHREECYAASKYAIERLKQIVPIWKQEIWEDGSEWKGHQLGPWDPNAIPNITS